LTVLVKNTADFEGYCFRGVYMSIRALALDLYKAQQQVAKLEKDIELASLEEKSDLAQELKFAQKEYQMIRKMLDGEKESGSFRKRFSKFGRFGS
jgi:hypothetical protein